MKVTPNFSTRELVVESRIKGVISENLVDSIQFEFNDDFLNYQIIVAFVDDKKVPIGGKLLTTSHLTGVSYNYPVPSGITQYSSVFYQIICNIESTGEVWKSNIDKIYFSETLNRVDEPITSYPLYPEWVQAINNANEAANGAIDQTNIMIGLESDLELAESLRASAELIRISSENDRVFAESARAFWNTYNELTTYQVGNKVYYLGSSYICHTISTGNLPTDTNFWSIIVEKGDKGDPGITSTITVGTVTSVNSITSPTVVNSGTINDAVFDFELPRGSQTSVGITQPTQYSINNPTVTNSGINGDVVLDFVIPRAPTIGIGTTTPTTYSIDNPDVYNSTGTNGDIVLDFQLPRAALVTVGTTNTGIAGSQATVINNGSNGDVVLDFTIPRGDKGETGNDFIILGSYDTLLDLQTAHPIGSPGDAWAVGITQTKDIYIWNTISLAWTTIGTISPSNYAADVAVQDVAGHFDGVNVETVLAEVQTNIDQKVETSLLSTLDNIDTVVVRDSNHDISLSGIQFTTNDINNPTPRRFYWDTNNGTPSFQLYNGVTLQLGQEVHFYGKAQGAIPNGSVVCLVGSEGNNPIFRLSDASNPTFDIRNIIGLSTSSANDGEMIYITSLGRVNDVNTNLIPIGTKLYFDPTVPGGLTINPPISPNPRVLIGLVLRSAVSGSILVKPYASDYLENLENVYINSILNGQTLVYNDSTLRYENKTLTPTDIAAEPANSNIQLHIASTDNPHNTSATQVGLGNVTNESKTTMFNNPTFTGSVILPTTTSIGLVDSTEIGYLNGATSNIQEQIGTLSILKTYNKDNLTNSINETVDFFKYNNLNIENQISNGNFNDGINGWSSIFANLSTTNNILTISGIGNLMVSGTTTKNFSAIIGHKLYAKTFIRLIGTVPATSISLLYGSSQSEIGQTIATLSNPIFNVWNDLSGLIEIDSNALGYNQFQIYIVPNEMYFDEIQVEIKKVIMVDLSNNFGVDYEPTLNIFNSWINLNYQDGWFDKTTGLYSKSPIESPIFLGIPKVDSNKIWHEGNDGSGSGLDADTIDGLHIPTITANEMKLLQVNTGANSLEWGPVANLTSGSSSIGFIKYNGLISTPGQFDGGTTAPSNITRLNYNGYLYATKIFNAVYNDYAEYFEKGEEVEPGDVISLDIITNKYKKSSQEFDPTVVGVFSDDFAHCIGGNGDGNDSKNFIPIGLAGRIKVKVIGKVEVGDLLVSSSINGVAMVGDKSGCVIGKALETSNIEGIKKIKMLILNK